MPQQDKNISISVVSPIYRGEKMLHSLVERVKYALKGVTNSYEIILVNDASPDNSWQEIERECALDSNVKGVNLSRNFGQHYAISAGLTLSKGEVVIVMDCDLQDTPEEIPNLVAKLNDGYDIVLAQRVNRKDGYWKRTSSKLFYALFSYLTDTKQDSSVANFGAYSRAAIDAILSMGDKCIFLPTMAQWIGFKHGYLPVTHNQREAGKSSYSFSKLMRLAFDNIISFSDKPMRLMLKFGFCISIIAVLIIIYYFVLYAIGGITVSGFTAVILSIWFSTGILISLVGFVGIYVSKTFNNTKQRPTFIIRNKINI